MRFLTDPVGLPGLIALGVGIVVFVITLLRARARGAKSPKSPDARRSNASIWGIALQAIGIAVVGFGPIRIELESASVKALVEGAIVLVLMLAAVGLFDSSSRAMGRNWALVARTRSDGQLVQTGPFAVIRNPIYVAMALFMLAMAIGYGHALNLIAGVPLFALGTGMRVRHEESVLRATFADYDAYAARVKRFIPGLF